MDWGQEEKGMTEDEMTGWHHWLNGLEFRQTPEIVKYREARRSPKSWTWLSNYTTTYQLKARDGWFLLFGSFLLYMLCGVSITSTEFQLFPSPFSIPLKPAHHLVSMCLLQCLLLGWFWVTLVCSQFLSLTAPEIYSFEFLGGSDSVVRHWKRITK